MHNGADHLEEAVASVLRQSLRDWELIIVDDGSTDGTAAMLTAIRRSDPRVRVITQPHAGIVAALNRGLAACTACFIARLDADDFMHPLRLELQSAALAQDPELGLVSCRVDFLGSREQQAGYALHVDWLNSLLSADDIRLNRFVEAPFAHPSVMFRRELVTRHGGYRAGEFPEDYELWLRWLDAGVKMAKLPVPLLSWRDRADRLSRTSARYSPEAFFRTKAPWIARELARSAAGRQVWIWGAGRPTRKRAAALDTQGLTIVGYVDIDPKKYGRELQGRPIVPPASLPAPHRAFVLGYVSTRGARDLIRHHLLTHGYQEGRDFLMCA